MKHKKDQAVREPEAHKDMKGAKKEKHKMADKRENVKEAVKGMKKK